MAEIRSTIDMVMERAAKMAAESKDTTSDENLKREGMRLAAEYLNNPEGNLREILNNRNQEEQKHILGGIADTLLRNIVLPRDDFLMESSLKSLEAITELSTGEVSSTCHELQQIISQYSQHKEQMITQLDEAIINQLEQKLAQQGTQLTEDMSINPAMHPQYQEELDKMLAGLNSQYNEALDQRKEMIRQLLLA